MSKVKRLFSAAVAAVMLLVCMTGCSAPKLFLGGTPENAATIGDVTISTGEYLAYLFTTFDNMYAQSDGYNPSLKDMEAYGYDVWSQTYTWGEGDTAEEVDLAEYIIRANKEQIVRQVAVEKMLKQYGLSWIEEDVKEVEENLTKVLPTPNEYLKYGINGEHFTKVYKALSLNENSLFFGLYGKGGQREMSEADRKAYFDENYLSFKIITKPMVDNEGNEFDETQQKKVLSELDKYLQNYNSSGNFEKVVDAYNKANASEGQEIKASTDEDNRMNYDATQMDEELVKAIRSVEIGKAKVVTYKAGGSQLAAALVLRLDPNKPETLFKDETDNIIRGAKYEAFNEEVEKAAAALTAEFNSAVIKKCDPKNFLEDAE